MTVLHTVLFTYTQVSKETTPAMASVNLRGGVLLHSLYCQSWALATSVATP